MNFKKLLFGFLCGALTLTTASVSAANARYYVKPGGTGDGSSWAKAAGDLNKLFESLEAGSKDEVWIAQGEYQLSKQLIVKTSISMYGGFVGQEENLVQRPKDGRSTIKGGEFPTLTATGETADILGKTIIDGFIFRGANCPKMPDGSYGNVYLFANSEIRNCVITDNIFQKNSAIGIEASLMYNCLIYNNTTIDYNGAVDLVKGSKMINCTIVNNTGNSSGAALRARTGCQFINCILWGNTTNGNMRDAYVDDPTIEFVNCALTGNFHNNSIANIKPVLTNCVILGSDNDPKFKNPEAGDFSLTEGSACIDKGLSSECTSIEYDILGNDRIIGAGVDIGAYEGASENGTDPEPQVKNVIYVKPNGTGDGSSWANAIGSVDAALALVSNDCGKDIWFAEGEYPLSARITIPRTVSLYGGFVGTETTLDQRDASRKSTIKGGTYASLLAPKRSEGQEPTYIDGFIFTGTNQISTADAGVAGNIELWAGRNIRNCIIKENQYQKCAGVYAGEDAQIINCLFYKNNTTLASACVTIGATAQIINSTIVNNYGASNSWGGLRVSGVDTKIMNTVIWGNTKDISGSQNPYQVRIDADGNGTFDHCAIQGELSGGDVSWKTPKQMISCLNLNADNANAAGPNFVNVADANYQLMNVSPLLNSGKNDFVATIPTDLIGGSRIQNGTVDMGAYEAVSGAGSEIIKEVSSLIAYPNPVQDMMVIIVDNAIRAEIYNVAGSLVYQSLVTTNGQLNLSDLNPGYYHLVVYTHNGVQKMPVIKK